MEHGIEAINRKLRESEQNYRQLFEANPHPMWVYNLKTLRFLAVNDAAVAHYGYSRDTFLAMTIADIRPAEDVPKLLENVAQAKNVGLDQAGQWRHRKHDGTLIDVEISSHFIDFQGQHAKLVLAHDITERKNVEAKNQRLTQLYAVLSQCNQAIVRCHSEQELFQEVCRAAVQFGSMKMAWVGLVDPASQRVTPVAQSGEGTQYLADITISIDPALASGRGTVGTAIREQRPVWCQNYLNDPMTAPWHDMAERTGWRAVATLPLTRRGVVTGAFVLFSDKVNAFDQAVRNLLVEMATDISYALDNFVNEAERSKAQEALRESEERFRHLTEMSSDFYWESDAEHRLTTHTTGIKSSSMSVFSFGPYFGKRRWERPYLSPDRNGWLAHQATLDAHQPFRNFELSRVATNGSARHFSISGDPVFDNTGAFVGYRGVGSDITERKRAEQTIQRHVEQLKTTLMHTVELATNLSELRDPYTAGHERRVAEIAAVIGAEMGLDDAHIEGLRVAGFLHDIGKITIPTEILSKPGKLSAIEYQLIQGHTQAGCDVLKSVPFSWPVAQVALQHHERMDGSGYPHGLKGEAIHLEARILAVADVVEAMSSHRPYRAALGIECALIEIERGRGSQYDGAVVDACLKLFREKAYSIPA